MAPYKEDNGPLHQQRFGLVFYRKSSTKTVGLLRMTRTTREWRWVGNEPGPFHCTNDLRTCSLYWPGPKALKRNCKCLFWKKYGFTKELESKRSALGGVFTSDIWSSTPVLPGYDEIVSWEVNLFDHQESLTPLWQRLIDMGVKKLEIPKLGRGLEVLNWRLVMNIINEFSRTLWLTAWYSVSSIQVHYKPFFMVKKDKMCITERCCNSQI